MKEELARRKMMAMVNTFTLYCHKNIIKLDGHQSRDLHDPFFIGLQQGVSFWDG
jgi:hypothetical protein